MSFITGLSEDITKAWNGTVDAVSGAGQKVGNFWNWLTGDSKSSENADIENQQQSPLLKNPLEDPGATPVSKNDAVSEKDDHSKYSLTHLLALFRAEAMHHCENKARVPYLKVKEAQEKNKELTELLQHLTAQVENKGDYEVKDEKTKAMFARARTLGVPIPDQTKFSKNERDIAIKNVDHSLKLLSDEIRIGFSDAQEALQQRNTFYQELKTCWDKLTEVIRKFIQALASRG